MSQIVFVLSICASSLIIVLSISALFVEKFEFYPPPDKDSWQYRIFWLLFRFMFAGLVFLSFSTFSSQPVFNHRMRYLVWLPLLIVGFGTATYLSAKLGWENAHGVKGGLVVAGVYRWSRNPIYVVSIAGMIGWGLFVNSCYVTSILSLWALMYFLAPFVEEPWLERVYGEAFLAYKHRSHRFIGLPKS